MTDGTPAASHGFEVGDRTALVGPSAVVLVEGSADPSFVDGLWRLVREDAAFGQITEFLVGHGLASLPSFAVVLVDGSVARVIARGSLGVVVTCGDGSIDTVDPGDALTWTERSVQDPDHAWLGPLPPLSAPMPTPPFELSTGRVPASWVVLRSRRSAGAAGGTAAVPDTTDAPPTEDPRLPSPGADPFNTGVDGEPHGASAGDAEVSAADPGEGAADDAESDGSDNDAQPGITVPPPPQVPAPPQLPPTPPAVPTSAPSAAGAGGSSETVRYDPDTPPVGDVGGQDSASVANGPGVLPDPAATLDEHPGTAEALQPTDASGPDGEQPVADEDDGLGGLFDATEHRPVSLAGVDEPAAGVEPVAGDEAAPGLISGVPAAPTAAAPAGEAAPPAVEQPSGDGVGDHDGMTISLAQLRAQQASDASGPPSVPPPPEESDRIEVVHAVSCPAGHLNPPLAASCRICGVDVPPQDYESVPRPVLGVLRFADGSERTLTRSMLLGRSPTVSGSLTGEQLPELVTLDSPSRELSGTHLEIRLEGWQVLAIDRRSTNGTTVQLPGRDPQRLHPGAAVPIVPGTVVDMAEEVQFTYEVVA